MVNNPFTLASQDMMGEPIDVTLSKFKEKANKCSTSEHMRIFCESYLEKYHRSPLRLTSEWQMEPTMLFTNSRSVDLLVLNNHENPHLLEQEIYSELLDGLVRKLMIDGFIMTQVDEELWKATRRFQVKIRVGKVKGGTK